MKREFTTNWYIYRVCLSSVAAKPKVQQCDSRVVSVQEELASSDCGFENVLLKAIDEGLSLLGDSSKWAVYFYLEKSFGIRKADIPSKIEEFVDAIEEIFGYGAKYLEIQIMKQLYEKVGQGFEYFPEKGDLVFNEYVKAIRLSNRIH